MAVPASYVALLDLGLHGGAAARVHEPTDVVRLRRRIAVIEFEHNGIALTAINARTGREIVRDQFSVTGAIDRRSRAGPKQICRDILPVVLFPVLAATRPAIGPVRAPRGVLDRELVQRFLELAAGTQTQEGLVRHGST